WPTAYPTSTSSRRYSRKRPSPSWGDTRDAVWNLEAATALSSRGSGGTRRGRSRERKTKNSDCGPTRRRDDSEPAAGTE
ncbi:hypothetical protein HPB47_023858, partial [Ixodes persulcatus]